MKYLPVEPLARRQAGAALIIGLILLMVMTVLGISGASRAILGLRMADNARQGQYAFEAAQAAIDREMLNPNPITFDDPLPGKVVRTLDPALSYPADTESPLATASASTVFRSEADLAPGSGWEAGTMTALHFEVQADGTTTARGGRSEQVAGFYVMAPK
jgi:type IV pilus assembly protein PilX